jgi:excisionase family DNA binding protein
MATSPAPSVSLRTEASDVFERLVRAQNLLTTKEVASILAISPKTVYAYVERNMIPHLKIETSVRFRGRDVAEWLKRHVA